MSAKSHDALFEVRLVTKRRVLERFSGAEQISGRMFAKPEATRKRGISGWTTIQPVLKNAPILLEPARW
ncbi:MAG: hypothetical protein ABSE36_15390, partial [Terracidiphilus sp.]